MIQPEPHSLQEDAHLPSDPLTRRIGSHVSDTLVVLEANQELAFSFEEMLSYHGGGSPGGVAHAFKVLERAIPLLDAGAPIERRQIVIETAFGGPGGRDGFELVTRAVTDGRFTVDPSLARPELGLARERFVFRLRYRTGEVTLTLRNGFVTEEFIALARRTDRTDSDEQKLVTMKWAMATRVMSRSAASVYDAAR
jgi:hypothetical protein